MHTGAYQLSSMLVSNIQFSYENICKYMLIYASIHLVFCMKFALCQIEHMIFVLLGLIGFTEHNGL